MKQKLTIKDLIPIIENEGLAYSINNYLSHEQIKDTTLADLWKKAQEAFEAVGQYIEDQSGMDFR